MDDATDTIELLDTERQSLDALLAQYEPVLLQIVASFRAQVRAGIADEDDLRQEARMQTYCLLRDFRPELNGNMEAYLRVKLRWRVANYLRAERRRRRLLVPLEEETLNHPTEEPAPTVWAGLDHPHLERALRGLSPRQRAVIARFYWQEQTVRQIAGALGVSPQAVTALRRRAEAALRETLRSK
jgi:RNA polymerase sigma-70 factor (ECF subfamily)